MRIAYLKYGDLVGPYSRYRPGEPAPDGGPDSYLHQFLERTEGHERLIVSVCDAPGAIRGPGVRGWNMHRDLLLPGAAGRMLGAAALGLRALPRLAAFRPGAVVAAAPNYVLSLALAARALTGCRVVFSCHSQLWARTGRLGAVVRRVKHRNILRADAAICHGPYLRGQLLALGCAEDRLMEFNAGHGRLAKSADGPAPDGEAGGYFLYVGRVEREKGALDLLEAFAPLPPEAGLVYAGTGGALEELTRRAGSDSRVRVLGWQPYESLGGLVKRALAMVVPSWDSCPEGRCKAVSEAHALGVPVIAPDTGFFAHGVRHGEDGLLYEANSVPAMRAAMAALYADADLAARLRAGARETGRDYLHPRALFGDALAWALFGDRAGEGEAKEGGQ